MCTENDENVEKIESHFYIGYVTHDTTGRKRAHIFLTLIPTTDRISTDTNDACSSATAH
jgi:hypothetical protein